MTGKIFERARIDDQGTIRGLEGRKGEDVLVLRVPRIAEGKPREVAEEIRRYVRAHRDLAERQYDEFTTRYGKPSEKVKELAGHLTPEEFTKKTKELTEFAEKRIAEVRKDVEAAYARVEKELETRAEALLKTGRKQESSGPKANVSLEEHAAAGSVENRKERAEREF